MKSDYKTEAPKKHSSAKVFSAITDVYRDEGVNPTSHQESFATLVERAERLLKGRTEGGDKQAIFLLGQLYYYEGRYAEAERSFDGIKDNDPRALFQLAVMYYDGLGTAKDHPRAVDYMRRVVQWNSPEAGSIRYTALYHIGIAYLEGYGVQQSNTEAESNWLLAADEGNPKACVKAQFTGVHPMPQAFFWHSEACGNGSLESQGALGIMYLYGQGIQQDPKAAMECLKEAAERGSVYAQAYLSAYYYHRKLYSRAAGLAKRISNYDDIAAIARVTDCLPEYVTKGVAIALFYYARCLELGKGVPQSKEQAWQYFTKAALLNTEVCKDLQMDIIFSRM